MVVIVTPHELGARSAWMRHTLLVAALASAGQDGAEPDVPGATLFLAPPATRSAES